MREWDFFFAARPLLHLPIWSIFLVSHHYLNPEVDGVSWLNLLLIVCLSFLAASAYYLNQVHDVQSDAVNRKLGFIHEGLISRQVMITGWIMTSIIPLGLAFLFPQMVLVIFVQLALLGYLYSAAPFGWKNRPLLGLLSNAYPFGFLVSITSFPDPTIDNIWQQALGLPMYFFLAVAAIYILTTIPDKEGDAAVGKHTLAVVWPLSIVKSIAVIALLLAALVATEEGFIPLMYLALVSVVPIFISLVKGHRALDLFAAKFPILLLTILAGYFYWEYIIFVVVLIFGTRLYYHRRFDITYPGLF
ncbi:MAG: hypothetical protein DRP47_02495 [Candidatus Zixiibacteriota bacterium]|nr:MAG: hypothetical protein DRP47_02495 [candidate division Zixibacteria bacterium]